MPDHLTKEMNSDLQDLSSVCESFESNYSLRRSFRGPTCSKNELLRNEYVASVLILTFEHTQRNLTRTRESALDLILSLVLSPTVPGFFHFLVRSELEIRNASVRHFILFSSSSSPSSFFPSSRCFFLSFFLSLSRLASLLSSTGQRTRLLFVSLVARPGPFATSLVLLGRGRFARAIRAPIFGRE